MAIEQNRATAIKFLTTMAHGLDESLLTEDFRYWGSRSGAMDLAAIKSISEKMRAIMPQLPTFTVVSTTAEDNRVAVEIAGKCVLANGKRYDNSYYFLLEFHGSRIKLLREYYDSKLTSDVLGLD